MKKIYNAITLLLLIFTACNDFPDELGYETTGNIIYKNEVQPDKAYYTYTVKSIIPIEKGTLDVEEVGVLWAYSNYGERTKVVGTFVEDTIVATISQLIYDKTIYVQPYILTTDGVMQKFSTNNYVYRKNNFAPKIDIATKDLSLKGVGVLQIDGRYSIPKNSLPLTSATLKIGNQSAPLNIEGIGANLKGKIKGDVDLTKYDITQTPMRIVIENAYGRDSMIIEDSFFKPYEATIDSCSISMREAGKLHVRGYYTTPKDVLPLTTAFVKIKINRSDYGDFPITIYERYVEGDIDINELLALGDQNTDKQLFLYVGNTPSVTQNKSLGSYKITSSSESSLSYPDDGEKEDCIRFCGIDWAKGDLLYRKGELMISDTQTDGISDINIDEFNINRFSNISTDVEAFHSYYDIVKDEINNIQSYFRSANIPFESDESRSAYFNIQGNATKDIVAAHFPGWALPTFDELNVLPYVSRQYGYIETDEGEKCYGYLFYNLPNPNKQVNSTTAIKLEAEYLNQIGLFFRVHGRYLSSEYNYTEKQDYISDKYFGNYYLSTKYIYIDAELPKVNKLERHEYEKGEDHYYSDFFMNVRPVKITQ